MGVCRQAATVISQKFGNVESVETNYFMFPPTPAWVSTESPRTQLDETSDQWVADEFDALFKMLASSSGRLRGERLEEFKRRVVATPGVLAAVSKTPKGELWSLLHHAAAGPAHDLSLTHWLIQMGALDNEPPYWRNSDLEISNAEKFPGGQLPNALAVHCAAKKGYTEIVRFILESGNFRDLDTKTIHTKESLVQIAVQKGEKSLCNWLMLFGAKFTGVNASGKYIWDYTSNYQWKLELKETVARKKVSEDIDAKVAIKGRDVASIEQSIEIARQSIQGAERPHPSEEATTSMAAASLTSSAEPKSSRGGKGKHKKAAKSKSQSSDVTTATNLVANLFVDRSLSPSEDKISALSAELELLKANAFASPIDREWCAKRVCTIYDHYHKSVSTVLSSGILSTGGMVKNELQDAGRVAVLLDAFRQHPRPPDPEPGEYSDVSSVLYALITPSDHESFMHFFIYMETVAVEAWYSGLRQLWRTIVGLMEGCLLSMQARHDAFRGLVEQYTYAHRGGVGCGAVSAPTAAIPRELEWYTSDHGITDSQDLLRLDRLYGCPHYMRVKVPSGPKNPAFAACRRIIDEKCSRVVYVDTSIVAGAETKEQLRAIETVVLAAAKQTGLKLQYDEAEDLNLRLVGIKGFEFSATGIVRKAS
jgi:hypothetical protein